MNEKQRLEKLQRKIQKYKNVLNSKENVQQLGIKTCKKAKAKISVAYISAIAASSILTKAYGLGYPIIRENIKACQEIEKTIDESGNVTKEKKGYNYYEWGGNVGYSKDNCEPYQEESTKKLYNVVSTDSYLNGGYYLETYDISAMSEEEIVALLQDNMDVFKTYLNNYKVEKLEETSPNEPKFKIKINEIDKNDFILVPETYTRNFGGNLFAMIFSLTGLTIYNISSQNVKFIKKYHKNPELASNNLCQKLLEETQEKFDKLERKLTK